MKKRLLIGLLLTCCMLCLPAFLKKAQAAATEITPLTISRPGEIDENKDEDKGIMYTKSLDMGETLYTITISERGWLVLDLNGHWVYSYDGYYGGVYLYKNASLNTEVFAILKTYTDRQHGRYYYYLDPGTYYLKDIDSRNCTLYGYFLPDSVVITHKLVKDKDNNGYTDTISFTPNLGTTYIKSGIVSLADVNKNWVNASTNADDVYSITENGEYTIKAVFSDTEWKNFPVMYSFSIYDIGKGNKTEKEDSKDTEVKLNHTTATIKVGETLKLKVTGAKAVSYKSSKKSVAKVSSSGKITGKKKGTATIKVTCDNGETYTCKVKVVKK